jgi:hypothetical protein
MNRATKRPSGIIPRNNQQRLDALYRYQILYSAAEEGFNKFRKIIANVFKVPMTFIALVDAVVVFRFSLQAE